MTTPTSREKRMEHSQRNFLEQDGPTNLQLNDMASKLSSPIVYETIKAVQNLQVRTAQLEHRVNVLEKAKL